MINCPGRRKESQGVIILPQVGFEGDFLVVLGVRQGEQRSGEVVYKERHFGGN